MDLSTRDPFMWCEAHQVESGAGLYWQLGPFRLWAIRDLREWTVSFLQNGDDTSDSVVELRDLPEIPDGASTTRFGFGDAPARIRLTPALAIRPIVVTPEEPFSLPPNEEATLYVSTPVWVVVEVGQPPVKLVEEASHRPSDTWFGESTRNGELCYATRTRATLDPGGLPAHVHRALSVVRIENRAGSVLEIEKIKLPTPYMSLYLDDGGRLWTEEVGLSRKQDGEIASVVMGAGPPAIAPGAERIVEPRTRMDRGFLDRTFGGLIRELKG